VVAAEGDVFSVYDSTGTRATALTHGKQDSAKKARELTLFRLAAAIHKRALQQKTVSPSITSISCSNGRNIKFPHLESLYASTFGVFIVFLSTERAAVHLRWLYGRDKRTVACAPNEGLTETQLPYQDGAKSSGLVRPSTTLMFTCAGVAAPKRSRSQPSAGGTAEQEFPVIVFVRPGLVAVALLLVIGEDIDVAGEPFVPALFSCRE